MRVVNDLGHTLDVPCDRGIFGWKCTNADYQSWRRMAVAIRRTVVQTYLKGGFGSRAKAVSAWLTSWLSDGGAMGSEIAGKYGTLAYVQGVARSLKEADPDLTFKRELWGMGTPIESYAGRFPPDAPVEIQWGVDPRNWVGATGATLALRDYVREGQAFVDEALDEGTLDESDLSGEHQRGDTREPQVVNWIPLAVAGVGIFGGVVLVAWTISLFVRARQGRVSATEPILQAAGTAAKLRGR